MKLRKRSQLVTIVKKDLEKFALTVEEVEALSKNQLKAQLRRKAKELAFCELSSLLQKSTKTKEVKFNELKMQEYLRVDSINKQEVSMLFALRTRCVRGIKSNFKNMFNVCQHCPLNCSDETPEIDTQEHILQCSALGGSDADINFMHANPVE